jgi:hypothetical protein
LLIKSIIVYYILEYIWCINWTGSSCPKTKRTAEERQWNESEKRKK